MANYSTVLNNKLTAIGASTIAESYDSAGALPTLLLTDIGEIAYTSNNGKLNAWNGTSWSTVGIVNTAPTVSSISGGALAIDGTPTVITFYDSDAEDVPLTWSYSVTSGSLGGTTVSVSGSTFTITPSTNSADAGSFTLSFIATDGINQASTSASYSLTFVTFVGTNYGYVAGGFGSGPTQPRQNIIDKFPFASSTNATDVGDLTNYNGALGGHSSQDYGYVSGGAIPAQTNIIQRWPFAAGGNASNTGTLTVSIYDLAGYSDKTNDYGYSSGGVAPPGLNLQNIIHKFPFATGSGSANVGSLTQSIYGHTAHSSMEHGYTAGGATGGGGAPVTGRIERFAYASGTVSSAEIGSGGVYGGGGISSDTDGYIACGAQFPQTVAITTIKKFAFASSVTVTTPNTLSGGRFNSTGVSSTVDGYVCSGEANTTPTAYPKIATVNKFPFASTGAAAGVFSLTVGRASAAGAQY